MAGNTYAASYRFGSNRVVEAPCFIYEVCVYKLSKGMVAIQGSKYYRSDRLANIKNEEVVLKKTKEYTLVKMIDIIGVPKDFIEENNLPLYKLKEKKNIKKKKK